MANSPRVVRRIAGIKFARTYNGFYVASYEGRVGELAIQLTRSVDTDRWTARVTSPYLHASTRDADLVELTDWLRSVQARHDDKVAARRDRIRLATRTVVVRRRRNDRRAARVGAVAAACAVGAYFVGIVVGVASVTVQVASEAASAA